MALGIDEPVVLGGGRAPAGDGAVRRLSDLIAQRRPEAVITHLPYDYHREHRRAYRLVREAIEWAAHTTARGDAWMAGRLLLMEVNTLIPTPDIIVDVSEAFPRKMEALRCYPSQLAKLPDGYYERFNELKAELRGAQGGCRYAEAFAEAPLARHGPFYAARSIRSLLGEGRAGRERLKGARGR